MKKLLNIDHLLFLGLIVLGISCTKVDYDPQFNATYPISGDWTIRVNDGTNISEPLFMRIYNTSFSTDSVWIDDNFTYWQTKTKVKVDMTTLTFFGTDAQNEYYDSQVSYADGKLIGNDSIYFEVMFSDDPDNLTYIYSGHRKVSYEEYNTH